MKNLCKNLVTHLQKMGSKKGSLVAIICLVLLSSTSLMASRLGSTVTITSWDQKNFILEIGNERYHAQGEITLHNIRPGKVRMKVLRNRAQYNAGHGNQGRGVVLYNGFIDVPQNSRVRAKVDRNKRLRITKVVRNRNHPTIQKPRRPANGQCTTNGNIQEAPAHLGGSHGFEPYSYEHTGNYGGASCMNDGEFLDLLTEIERACFSSDKLRIAKMALRHEHISALQLEKLIRAMDFDREQLEIAKAGYPKVMDKRNIWKVYDAFSFSSTAREFEEFTCQY